MPPKFKHGDLVYYFGTDLYMNSNKIKLYTIDSSVNCFGIIKYFMAGRYGDYHRRLLFHEDHLLLIKRA